MKSAGLVHSPHALNTMQTCGVPSASKCRRYFSPPSSPSPGDSSGKKKLRQEGSRPFCSATPNPTQRTRRFMEASGPLAWSERARIHLRQAPIPFPRPQSRPQRCAPSRRAACPQHHPRQPAVRAGMSMFVERTLVHDAMAGKQTTERPENVHGKTTAKASNKHSASIQPLASPSPAHATHLP